ncbi:flavoprotein-like protein [Cokeromyces recurvatus]|uniref:flavoprotein-like protein n=1 Tax=Cokeromyces recurvatus TaxID=90255 RepID=UPI00222053D2|nr:flavoprotein-like protein [Cokeromyces recurvatus]KAI7900870.1 flavoprotein-like protein [Cokeromyces recurvatus]
MNQPVVYIVLYSLYHHVYTLSLSIKEGLESEGVHVKLFQVSETLSDTILNKMHAPSKPDIPIITVDQLTEPDGLIFGLPTRFGTMPAQMKNFLDASGAIWAKGALAGKFAGAFFSTASQHGGQESTAWAIISYFAHQGMLYVPFGYAHPALQNNDEVIGGSAYGAGTITEGDGSRQPSQFELTIAHNQGKNFGTILRTFVKGKSYNISNSTTHLQAQSAVLDTAIPAGHGQATKLQSTNDDVVQVATSGSTQSDGSRAANIGSYDGNAIPSNTASGVPDTPAGNAPVGTVGEIDKANTAAAAMTAHERDTTTTTTTTNLSKNEQQRQNINDDTITAPATTTAEADPTSTAATNTELPSNNNKATKTGTEEGITNTNATTATPTKTEKKPNKLKKLKWFCCG